MKSIKASKPATAAKKSKKLSSPAKQKRFIALAVVALVVGIGLIWYSISSAATIASSKCVSARFSTTTASLAVCVQRVVSLSGTSSAMQGYIKYSNALYHSNTYPLNWTVALIQCDGYGHNCGAMAANGSPNNSLDKNYANGTTYYDFTTALRDHASGHVYKTCGSVQDNTGAKIVNLCTPFLL